MVQIIPEPLFMTDVLLTIGANDHEWSASSVVFTPASSAVTWQGLSPRASFTAAASASWTLALTYVQDWDTPGSLSRYLHDNQGATVPMTFEPKRGGTPWTANVVITPGAIGGAVNSFAEGTVTLGVSGAPVPGTTPTP